MKTIQTLGWFFLFLLILTLFQLIGGARNFDNYCTFEWILQISAWMGITIGAICLAHEENKPKPSSF